MNFGDTISIKLPVMLKVLDEREIVKEKLELKFERHNYVIATFSILPLF